MEIMEKVLLTRLASDRNIDVMNHIQEIAILGFVGLGLIADKPALKKIGIGVGILGIADHVRCAIIAKKHRENIINSDFIENEDERNYIKKNSTMKSVLLNYNAKDFIS